MARNLVYALSELGVGIGHEPRADPVVTGLECCAAVLAQVMAASGDAHMHAIAVAQNRVHAKPAVAGLPLARVCVVADAGNHFPGVAAVTAAEEGRRLDAAPQL